MADTIAFASCLSSDDALAVVRKDSALASELGIEGTPGVLLDSLLFEGVPHLRYLQAYVAIAAAATH